MCSDGNDMVLEIKKIAIEDGGRYICKVLELTTECILTVDALKQKYTFNQKLPPTATVLRKKEITLECSISDPRAGVKWYRNGEELQVSKQAT